MHRRILVVDAHLRVAGPAVIDLVGAFLENWTEATGGLPGAAHFADIAEFDGGVGLQVTRSTSTRGSTAATQLFYSAIAGAQRRLWLTTAYFASDRDFEDVLCDAARRGVDVRILVNGTRSTRRWPARPGGAPRQAARVGPPTVDGRRSGVPRRDPTAVPR